MYLISGLKSHSCSPYHKARFVASQKTSDDNPPPSHYKRTDGQPPPQTVSRCPHSHTYMKRLNISWFFLRAAAFSQSSDWKITRMSQLPVAGCVKKNNKNFSSWFHSSAFRCVQYVSLHPFGGFDSGKTSVYLKNRQNFSGASFAFKVVSWMSQGSEANNQQLTAVTLFDLLL